MKAKLCVSVSGGRTSAYMARWVQLNLSHLYDVRYVFANTGQEHPNTLDFIRRCAIDWGMDIEWIESVVDPDADKGTKHRPTSFESAVRDGSLFEAMISKYGIPNQAYPHCTRELKLQPIKDWRRVNGWNDCLMAIGIRADEIDRMSPTASEDGIIYPLISMKRMTKPSVIEWWRSQPFDLDVPERLGNCVWCWKKTVRKHLTNISEDRSIYDFPLRMERDYGLAGHNEDGTHRVFFRQNTSTADLIAMAARPFVPFVESIQFQDDWIDQAAGCSESCDVFAG